MGARSITAVNHVLITTALIVIDVVGVALCIVKTVMSKITIIIIVIVNVFIAVDIDDIDFLLIACQYIMQLLFLGEGVDTLLFLVLCVDVVEHRL